MSNFYNRFAAASPLTAHLITINVLVFLACFVMRNFGIDLNNVLGLHYYDSDRFQVWQMFSYMFCHANLSHLFFNMFSLFFIGQVIERFWGVRRYLIYYLTCGVGAALVQQLFWRYGMHDAMAHALQAVNPGADWGVISAMSYGELMTYCQAYVDQYCTIGASGSVFGLLLAFGMMFPEQPVYLYFLLPIKAKYFVWGYGLIEFFAGIHGSAGDSVAHFAHLGGMLFGLILILMWRKRNL